MLSIDQTFTNQQTPEYQFHHRAHFTLPLPHVPHTTLLVAAPVCFGLRPSQVSRKNRCAPSLPKHCCTSKGRRGRSRRNHSGSDRSLTYTRATKNSRSKLSPFTCGKQVYTLGQYLLPLTLHSLYFCFCSITIHTHKLRCSGRTTPSSTVTLPNPNLPLPAERQAKSAPPQTKQVAMNDRYTNYPQDRDPHHHHHAPASRTPSYSLPSYPSVPPKQIPHHHHHHHSSSSSSTSPGITDATPIRYSGYAQGPPSLSTSSISSSSYAGSADGENGDGDVDLVALLTERLAGAFDPLQLDRSLAVQAQTYATFHSLTRPLGGGG